jgi:hypothetical protein
LINTFIQGNYVYDHKNSAYSLRPPWTPVDTARLFQPADELTILESLGGDPGSKIHISDRAKTRIVQNRLGLFIKIYCCDQIEKSYHLFNNSLYPPTRLDEVSTLIKGKYDHPAWDWHNVEYIIDDFDPEYVLPKRFRRLNEYTIKNLDVVGRVFFTNDVKLSEYRRYLEYVEDYKTYASELNLPHLHAALTTSDPGATRYLFSMTPSHDIDGKLEVDVTLDTDGYLFFNEIWAPDWSATVDGIPTEIIRANGFTMAIFLSEGDHSVEFNYKPLSNLIVQSSLFLLAFLLAGIVCWTGWLLLQPVINRHTTSNSRL